MSTEFDTNEVVGLENKTNAEIGAELATLELEEKQLDLEIKRETVAKIRAQRNARLDENRAKQRATIQFLLSRKRNQDSCNHRKGGIGVEAVLRGEGTDAMYSVAKHCKPTNIWMVLCNRCGKEWHDEFRIQGILIEPAVPSKKAFDEAIRFPSDNTPSKSANFQFQIDDIEVFKQSHESVQAV